ncbi:MAG: GLPGLI family protein [Cytophagaceae bacterium]|nr:MAG: GLPGLI family protein [Cytophagaceae bacterium]
MKEIIVCHSRRRCTLIIGFFLSGVSSITAQHLIDSVATGRVMYQQTVQFAGSRLSTVLQTELLFNKETSLYRNTATRTRVDTNRSEKQLINLVKEVDVTVYSTPKTGQLVSREYIMNKLVTVQDTLRALPWTLGTRSRQIGKFTCQDASVTFRGRTYEAWFAAAIPIPYGPWKLQGLPGLILEANDREKEVIFSLLSVDYPLATRPVVHAVSNQQTIDYVTYRKLLDEKLRNMEKLMRGASSSAGNQYEVDVKMQPALIERTVR